LENKTMQAPETRNQLLEALADRMLEHFPARIWSDVFNDPIRAGFQVECRQLTILVAECAAGSPGMKLGRFPGLVNAYGGWVDTSGRERGIAAFDDPRDALTAAIELQHGERGRVRIGLASGVCQVATFQAQNRHWKLLAGDELKRAEAIARRATPGKVQLGEEVFTPVELKFEAARNGASIMARFEREHPEDESKLSAFADTEEVH
jgi:hypothetical protein